MKFSPPTFTLIIAVLWRTGIIAEQTKPSSDPLSPEELKNPSVHVHSLEDLRSLEEYFYRDLLSENPSAVWFALDRLRMLESNYPRLLAVLRHQIVERAKNEKRNDQGICIGMMNQLSLIGDESDITLLKNLQSPNAIVKREAESDYRHLEGIVKRVREGKPRYIKSDTLYDPSELPPETSPLSRPIPPLKPVEGSFPELATTSPPAPSKAASSPTKDVNQTPVQPFSVKSVVLWLAVIIIGAGGSAWLHVRSMKRTL